MKHRLLGGLAAMFCASAFGAVPSDAFWSTGFDTEAAVSAWEVNTTTAPSAESTKIWYFEPNSGFNQLNSASTGSVGFVVTEEDEKCVSTFTSPLIDASEHASMLLNFTAHDINLTSSWEGVSFWIYAIPEDGGSSTIYTGLNGPKTPASVDGWYNVKCELPASCNKKKFRIQIKMQVNWYDGAGRHMYFDDMYITEKPGTDAKVTAITPTEVKSLDPVPVGISVFNNGSKDLSNFKISYMIDKKMPAVTQDVTEVIAPGETKTLTFTTPADMSTMGESYTITGMALVDGDANMADNTMDGTATNIITKFPYTANFPNTSSKDYWTDGSWSITTDRNNDNIVCWTARLARNSTMDIPLYSRPIYLEAGKTVGLNFSTWVNNYTGILKAYVMDNMDNVYPDEPIITANCNTTLTDFSGNFTPTESGIYYICLRGWDETANTGMRNIYAANISLSEPIINDIAAVVITAPAATAKEYSDAEAVTFKYTNKGLEDANNAQAMLIIDGQVAATEAIPAIKPGEEKEYTFTKKVDLSGNNKGHKITVRIVDEADQVTKNNEVSSSTIAEVFYPPYYVDTYNNDFIDHWSWEDKNQDGVTFEIAPLYGNDRIRYNDAGASVESINDVLYSRPIKMRAGKVYRLRSDMGVFKKLADGEELPEDNCNVTATLYKVVDGKRTRVKELGSIDIPITQYVNDYFFKVDPTEEGMYSIGLALKKNTPNSYYFGINEFEIFESGDVELSLGNLTLAGKAVSGNTDFMVAVPVNNNGFDPVSKFSLKVSAPSMEAFTYDVELEEPITAGSYRRITIDKVFKMNITKDETLTVELVAENDAIASNNISTAAVAYKPAYDVPATIDMDEVSGWRSFDMNGDWYPQYSSYYEGFDFNSRKEGDPEEVMTPGFNFKAGKTYAVKFDYLANNIPTPTDALNIYMVDMEGNRTPVAVIASDPEDPLSYYTNAHHAAVYATAPADGVYNFIFADKAHPDGDYSSYSTQPNIQINNGLTVEEVTTLPDLQLTGFKSHTEAGTYGNKETVKVGYKNNGTVAVAPASFSLKVGETTYHAVILDGIEPETEGEVEFTNVDLYNPGEYTMTATTLHGADATPADNTVTNTLDSKPIIEAGIASIDGPRSGNLGRHEHIAVTVVNNGKGTLKDFPISYTLTREGGEPVVVTENVPELAEDSRTKFTFAADADFSEEGTYTIEVKVNLEDDIDAENNVATTKVNSTQAAMDAGVDGIVGPTGRLMTNAEQLIISVHNYGVADLYDVPVTASVIRGDEVLATVTGEIPEISAGKSVEYTFPGTVDIALGGDYTIEAATTLEGDVNKDNDKFSGKIYANMIDCGVDAILSPAADTPAGEQVITVRIKNFGDEPVSNIPVYFKLGTNPQAGKYDGTIEPGETTEYSFTSKYNFREGRDYTLNAYTDLESDMNPDNDACELAITPVSGLNGVSIDGVNVYAGQGFIAVLSEVSANVAVFNASGATVADKAVEGKAMIPASAGIYLVKVATADQQATYKVIVK